jgi:hypothetical protein
VVDGSIETGDLARARWNVVGLLEHISKKAVSADLFCDVDMEEALHVDADGNMDHRGHHGTRPAT